MTRKKSQRRDWRMTVFLGLSLLMVLIMVIAAIIPAFQN